MEITCIGELLYWSYANLAMAHSAITAKADKYGRTQFMIRSRLFAGLNKRTMHIGLLAEDERLKMILPQACCYCGSREHLSVDHLIPTKRGGENSGDNLVWACRSCNSSKGAIDALECACLSKPASSSSVPALVRSSLPEHSTAISNRVPR